MKRKRFDILPWLGFFEKRILSNYWLTKTVLEHVSPSLLEKLSRRKAFAMHGYAKRHVPAYTSFAGKKKFSSIEEVPETDKNNYIKRFGYEQRCLYGEFPQTGNIEESSGSSGAPTNWIRSLDEEALLFQVAKFEFFYTFDSEHKKYIVLSGWSNGPWSTGLKFCEIIQHFGLVKNATADIDNIIRTMKQLGKKHEYLIAGYPPFLKTLFDSTKISWKDYKIDVLTGGEASSVAWKKYIRARLGNLHAAIISSYGASDIDIGVGFETPFSEFVRELAKNNPKLNEALFQTASNPILFQYNPLMHYIENTKKKDFTITLLDPSVCSPKIKYNLHDNGAQIPYSTVIKTLRTFEAEKLKKYLRKNRTLRLPFLFVNGRVDGTISIGGNNIYPQQISDAIQESSYGKIINRFMIGNSFDAKQNVHFDVHVELQKNQKIQEKMEKELSEAVLSHLLKVNLEYNEYYHNHAANQECLRPLVHLYGFDNEKMFQQQDGKIKNSYIIPSAKKS